MKYTYLILIPFLFSNCKNKVNHEERSSVEFSKVYYERKLDENFKPTYSTVQEYFKFRRSSLNQEEFNSIKEYLDQKEELMLDSMFITDITRSKDKGLLQVHMKHISTLRLGYFFKLQDEFMDSIFNKNPNQEIIITIPPNGNRSGKDRVLTYSLRDSSISELYNQ